MSGGLSVPFTFLALFSGLPQRNLFLILAFVGLLVLIVSLTIQVVNLRDKQKPKLRIIEDRWCKVHETRSEDTPFIFLRLAVTNEGLDEITDCKGHLTAIENEKETIWGGVNLQLAFAPEEDVDATSKTIRAGYTEYLDVIAIQESGIRFIGTKGRHWPGHFQPLNRLFKKGDYFLTLNIAGRDTATVTKKLRLTIAENYRDCSLSPA